MFGSWLTRAVYVLGLVLILVGLGFISSGVPMVRLEIGWTEIIGGSVAASAGCIIVVLGLFLARLEALQGTLDRLAVTAAPLAPVVAPSFGPPLDYEPEPEPVVEPTPVPARAEPVRFPVLHPLAPPARRERVEPVAAIVQPEPALMAAAHVPEPVEAAAAEPPEVPVLEESAPALVHAEEEASHSPAVEPVVAPEPAKPRSNFLSSILSRRMLTPPWREPEHEPAPASSPEEAYLPLVDHVSPAPLRRTVVDLSSGWDEDVPEPAPALDVDRPHPAETGPSAVPNAVVEPPVADAAPPPEVSPLPEEEPPVHLHEEPVAAGPAEAPPLADERSADIHTLSPKSEPQAAQPVVVGRYNAGAASYVMYSNGMIEVETEQGTHQFASMQELKAFIERRDTAARAY